MLLDDVKEAFILMDLARTSDGEGGYTQSWVEGAEFQGVKALNTTTEAIIAQQQGLKAIYSLLVPKSLPIAYQDIVKDEQGDYFRVTSSPKDKQTPDISALDMQYFTAEKLEGLPT